MDTWPIWLLVALYLGWQFVGRLAGKVTDRVAIEPLVDRLLTRQRATETFYVPRTAEAYTEIGGCSAPGRPTSECGREYIETHCRW
jgi:hypothetical protein